MKGLNDNNTYDDTLAAYNEIVEQCQKKESLDKKANSEKFFTDERVKDFGSMLFQVKTFGNIVIIHCAMCLESFINDYCVIKRSSRYFKSNIEMMDLRAKWIVVPKLITDKEIPTDGLAFERIGKLISSRNSLVHPKSREFETGDNLKPVADGFGDLVLAVPKCFEGSDIDARRV